jgi:chromosome segregation ATPase
MKTICILSIVISFAMICSCQKQDSAAEQQLAQRKVELDAREHALDEREKELAVRETVLKERENALAKSDKAATNTRALSGAQSQKVIRDPAQLKAERERRIQQLPPEIRALIPDQSQVNAARADKDRQTQERLTQRQDALDGSQSQKQYKLEEAQKAWMSQPAVSSSAEDQSPAPSSAAEAASPTASPTPE